MRIVLYISLFAVVGLLSQPKSASAWSGEGHEAVCEIAYQELTDNAKAAVNQIVDGVYGDRYKTFREGCTWPDNRGWEDANGENPGNSRRLDHYVNLDRDMETVPEAKCYVRNRCTFTAMETDIAVLRSSASSTDEMWQALYFLGHWVGDIHQPLHVSFRDDAGGNDVDVIGVQGCSDNLHSVWDRCIPRQIMMDADLRVRDTEGFARMLVEGIRAHNPEWANLIRQAAHDPVIWARESFEITRRAGMGYCEQVESRCDAIVGARDFRHRDYERDFADIAEIRLQMAGIRLGAILNQIFDQ